MMKKIAILATHGFEESELKSPKEALERAGYRADIVSPQPGKIKAWSHGNWTNSYDVDQPLKEAKAADYDALLLPGGVLNPDQLRTNEEALVFVRDFFTMKKPVAAICHGPQVLISADVVKGRTLTSYKSIRDDLINAGALWKDEAVVVDKGLVTSRYPGDLPAFIEKMIEEIKEGRHEKQHA